MGTTPFCKCFAKDVSFLSSDPNKSSLNPNNSGVLEFVKNKKYDIPPPTNNKTKPPTINLKDFKIEKV